MNEGLAKTTAKWWREKITCAKHDNGDQSFQCILAGMFADLNAMKNAPTNDQLDAFEENLVNMLVSNTNEDVYLNCDYNPCEMLYEAATNAGIDASVFPWKTNTRTTEDAVYVSDGYGAKWVKLS